MQVDKGIVDFYIFALKRKVAVADMRSYWFQVHTMARQIAPNYQLPKVPGWLKIANTYKN